MAASRRDAALPPHVRAGVADPLADPHPLELRHRGQDRQNNFADAIAADIAAKVEQPETDTTLLEQLDRLQRVERRTEHAVELRADHDVASLQLPFSSRPPSGRSANGIEPGTPASMNMPASCPPISRARPSILRCYSSRLTPLSA